MYKNSQSGTLIVLVLIFGSIFFIIIASFMGFVISQNRAQEHKLQGERALAIAEGGLNYYRWYLAHYPDDVTHGTGNAGPHDIPYQDFEAGLIGTSTLEIAEQSYCGVNTSIDIRSTGRNTEKPEIARSVYARYARPSVAEYAYIINSDVWAGPGRIINGPYHSNGGVRMDGVNNSTVTSGRETWSCTSEFGCNPTDPSADGVFGGGGNDTLWDWPVPNIEFDKLGIDLMKMRTTAQNNGGVYIGPSGRSGYRISFQDDGSYNLYIIRNKENEPQGNAYGYHLNKVKNSQYQGNFDIDPDCPLIFVEDDLWIDGEINGKVTVAAATDVAGITRNIVLQGNITYTDDDDGFLAIAQNDLLVGFDVPNDMEINGIFVAQAGHFGRNDYSWFTTPAAWQQYVFRDSLTINGTIVSNGRVGTQWVYGDGTIASGFIERFSNYDRRLVLDPPPLTPKISDNYSFIEWRQE